MKEWILFAFTIGVAGVSAWLAAMAEPQIPRENESEAVPKEHPSTF